MTYSICAIVSVFILYYIEHNQGKVNKFGAFDQVYSSISGRMALLFFFAILVVYWTLIIGLQYETGTDYVTYREIFSSINRAKFYSNNFELLFYYIALFLINNKINPQFGFIIIGFIQFCCFFWFISKIRIKYYYLFIFLYFFVSVAFYNQTNVIRQYTAVYIFLMAIYFMYSRKLVPYLICILIAGLFHISAFLLVPVYFFRGVLLKCKHYIFMIVVSFIISIFGIDKLITFVIPFIGKNYAHYLTSAYGTTDIQLINRLTKYIFIPFYLLSIKSRRNLIDSKDIFFYNLGFVSFCIKIGSLSSPLLSRFAYYCEILTIFPLFYLLIYLFKGGKQSSYREERFFALFVFLFMSFSLLFVKLLLFPIGEYAYKSVFSRYF
jgi:hypothetical protein